MVRMIPPGPSRQPTRLSARRATLLASMACSARSERCQPPVGLWAPTPDRSNSAAPDDLKSQERAGPHPGPFLQIRLGTAWITCVQLWLSGTSPDAHRAKGVRPLQEVHREALGAEWLRSRPRGASHHV